MFFYWVPGSKCRGQQQFATSHSLGVQHPALRILPPDGDSHLVHYTPISRATISSNTAKIEARSMNTPHTRMRAAAV